MKDLSYTLLTDGSSDRALMPILNWLLQQLLPGTAIQAEYADLRMLPRFPKEFSDRITEALKLYPCQILFIHRDAEKQSIEDRVREIDAAVSRVRENSRLEPFTHVAVVPIRMTEAWLLIDESSLRRAAGNPNGKKRLAMPPLRKLESFPDPKELLYKLILDASECNERRKKMLNVEQCVHKLADNITDYSSLRELSAFNRFEKGLVVELKKIGFIS